MPLRWFVGLFTAATLSLAEASVAEVQSTAPQDAVVLEAVVKSELWFRPSERAAQVFAVNQTLPVCPQSVAGRPCVRAGDVERLVHDEPRTRRFWGRLSSAARVELVESFKARNKERRETPRVPGVMLVPQARLFERTETTAKHYSVFSLPANARDDHAIVVVQHLDATGGSDNQELIYLLTRSPKGWRVTSKLVLWVA